MPTSPDILLPTFDKETQAQVFCDLALQRIDICIPHCSARGSMAVRGPAR
jgi:hypothetical protein